MDAKRLARRAARHFIGEIDTAIDPERKGIEVENRDRLIGLCLFQQPLNFGEPFRGPALTGIAKLTRIVAQQRLRIRPLHLWSNNHCSHQ
jgi:hypothetical protein